MSNFTNLLRLVAFDVGETETDETSSERTAKRSLERAADIIDKQDAEIARLKAEIEAKDAIIERMTKLARQNDRDGCRSNFVFKSDIRKALRSEVTEIRT